MKAVTLWQPWASLIIEGVKKYETRKWVHQNKVIVIHAAKTKNGFRTATWRPELGALGRNYEYPFGYALGIVRIKRILSTDDPSIPEEQKPFGDYSEGRKAWELEILEKFERPVKCTGHQAVWEYNE